MTVHSVPAPARIAVEEDRIPEQRITSARCLGFCSTPPSCSMSTSAQHGEWRPFVLHTAVTDSSIGVHHRKPRAHTHRQQPISHPCRSRSPQLVRRTQLVGLESNPSPWWSLALGHLGRHPRPTPRQALETGDRYLKIHDQRGNVSVATNRASGVTRCRPVSLIPKAYSLHVAGVRSQRS